MGEFYEALAAFRAKEDAERRHVGELVRGATMLLFNLQIKKKITDPRRFWPMPWDDMPDAPDEEIVSMTEEERQDSIKGMKRLMGL